MAFPRQRSILPGFGLSLGFTLMYLSLIVLIPLSAAFVKTAGMSDSSAIRTDSSRVEAATPSCLGGRRSPLLAVRLRDEPLRSRSLSSAVGGARL